MDLKLWALFISQIPKGLFHRVMNNMADGEESLTPSSPIAWTCNKFPANAIWWQVMCGIQYSVLFIYFPGIALLLVIHVLLCMICCWDLWHGVCRVFGRCPRLKRSHGFGIMWQHSAPSMMENALSRVSFLFFFVPRNGRLNFIINSDSCKRGRWVRVFGTTTKYLEWN